VQFSTGRQETDTNTLDKSCFYIFSIKWLSYPADGGRRYL